MKQAAVAAAGGVTVILAVLAERASPMMLPYCDWRPAMLMTTDRRISVMSRLGLDATKQNGKVYKSAKL